MYQERAGSRLPLHPPPLFALRGHTCITHSGGEKNTMLSVAGLCGPTSGEMTREVARIGACSQDRQ